MSEQLLKLLKKHKLVGLPAKPLDITSEEKDVVVRALKEEAFFRNIEECEKVGTYVGYDEIVDYALPTRHTPEKESAEVASLLLRVFGPTLDSFYLGVHGERGYLHLRYSGLIEKLIIGPVETPGEESELTKRFQFLWGKRVEHRRFEDGKIRICANWKEMPLHAMPYVLLSKIFSIAADNGRVPGGQKNRRGRLVSPVIALEPFFKTYALYNRPGADEPIRKALDRAGAGLPVKVLSAVFTGSAARKTRILEGDRAIVYLNLGAGYRWPVENTELFGAAVTALNGILGKSMHTHTLRVEGLSKSNTLYAQHNDEKVELVFNIEEEAALIPQKYSLMHFRLEYQKFFNDITQNNKVFAEICVLIKQLLFAHGFYPFYLGDIAVELLCFRTAYGAKTLSGGLKAVVSTQYSRGYQVDIRRGKHRVRAKADGKINIVHTSGMFSIDLPEGVVFDRVNQMFRMATACLDSQPGINIDYSLSPAFKHIFVPDAAGTSFSLSTVPYQGYTEISHHSAELGGNAAQKDTEYCFAALREIGCFPYFCSSGRLLVQVENEALKDLAVGMTVLLTGMKYIKKEVTGC
ncbi:hypothetical protein NEDG_01481 [Nematocida displodere]|uniref:Nrap protein domain-containing protein n=1 Tax=Nematocida displodere TaxID=1805483 RepID=A0A177EDA4_9MICR|nr:hypothetical protein NEDG_01481 [Nematocida displodere]